MADTHASIDLEAIKKNAQTLSDFAQRPILAPIKADAYGHGAVQVAKKLELEEHIVGFAIATVSEALELRAAGISKDIVLLTPPPPENIAVLIHNQISFVVSSVAEFTALECEATAQRERPKIHLKINTGLNRLGASEPDAITMLKLLVHSNLELYGIMTHLVDSEDIPALHAEQQVQRFNDFLRQHQPSVKYRHLANTGAVLNKALNAKFDLIRPGIGLYGYAPGADCEGILSLEPAMTLYARVIHVKSLEQGQPVSYNATWNAPENTRIATVRLGYADGYPRAVSNKAQVLLRGQKVQQIGRVCMDQLLLEIGDLDANTDDLIEVFGNGLITADHVATWANTNSYEILTGIGARVPRVFT
jgi:alanine racemase